MLFHLGFAQEISPYLVGSNYWYQLWEKPEVMSEIADGSFDIIRIGGNGFNRTFPDHAILEGWVNEVKSFGAEPLIQVSAFSTPAEVAATVQYFNVDNDNRIKLWSIGNEPDLGNEMTTPEMYEYIVSHAEAMKAADSTILIFVPDLAGPHFEHLNRLVGGDLDITGLKQNSYFLIDGISWHRYAFWYEYDRADVMGRIESGFGDPAYQLIDLMNTANANYGRNGDNKLKWSLGEFNINVALSYDSSNELYRSEAGIGTHSFLNGQFFAEIFDLCMREEAYYATSWSIHESGGGRVPGDLGLIDGDPDDPHPRSSFYHSILVAENIRGTYLSATDNKDLVTVFGGKHTNADTIGIMILNKELTTDFDYTLRLNNDPIVQTNPLEITVNADIDVEFAGSIAPQSTQVLLFDTHGVYLRKIEYTLSHAIGNIPPTVLEPGEDTVIVALFADKDKGCVNSPTEFSAVLSSAHDSVKWNFGEGAVASDSTGKGPISVVYSSIGSKTIKIYLSYNSKTDTVVFDDFIDVDSCLQKPYNGFLQEIPGVIQGVFFDEGGNGTAYYDTDIGNNGPGPRQDEDVDTENGDAEGNVGWTEPDEWLEYTIKVIETNTYKAEVNYASLNGGGSFRLLFDGVDKTGNISVPSTGAWTSYNTLTIDGIELEESDTAVMRLEIIIDGFNFSSLNFSEDISTALNKSTNYEVKIFPNPVADNFTIVPDTPHSYSELKIISLEGKTLFTESIENEKEIYIDLSDFSKGIYIIWLVGEETFRDKFVLR